MSKLSLIICIVFLSFFNLAIAVPENKKADNTTLTDADRQQVQNLIHFLNNLPPSVKKEVKEYRKYYKELLEESQILYESLSKDAKDALKEEKDRKQHFTPAAQKELKKYLKELND